MGKAIGLLVLGIFAGLVTMYIVIGGIEYASHAMYPPPPGLNPNDMTHLGAILAAAPFAALAMLVVAWGLGAFAGGWVAAKISRVWPRSAAIVVALFVLLGVIGMILMVPGHPMWVAAFGIVLPVPLALLAARLARPRVVATSP
jgi:hypothetical protein